jgi:hypothetical protein
MQWFWIFVQMSQQQGVDIKLPTAVGWGGGEQTWQTGVLALASH